MMTSTHNAPGTSVIALAWVASVAARVRRGSWEESQKKGVTGEGEGKEVSSSPLPLPLPFFFFFFRSRSNFRAITRLETLARQAIIPLNSLSPPGNHIQYNLLIYSTVVF